MKKILICCDFLYVPNFKPNLPAISLQLLSGSIQNIMQIYRVINLLNNIVIYYTAVCSCVNNCIRLSIFAYLHTHVKSIV